MQIDSIEVEATANRMIGRLGIKEASWWANEHAFAARVEGAKKREAFWRAVRDLIHNSTNA